MKDTLAGALERARTTLSTISLGQKVVIGLLTVGLVLGGWFFYRWITAPTYAPLFSNLAASDASAIVDELNSEGVSYQLADGGATVEVPKNEVYDLRLTMSGKGLPAGNDTGYSLLDQQGITTSEFQQQVTYQRALEGELAKTLQAIDGVQTAVVHVAMPKDEVFTDDQQKPTASVLLALRPGTKLKGEQVQAVTHLVSSSIQGMDPAQVTVADSTGNVLSAAGDGVDSAVSDVQSQQEQAFEAQLASNAQAILDKVLGPDHAEVQVRADLDFSQRSTTSETYNYTPGTPPVSQSTSSEKYTGSGSAVGGVLGPENQSNASTTGSGSGNYDKSSSTADNAVGKTTETVQQAPGQVKRLTVSVVLDGTKAGALNQQQVSDLIGNAVGLDTVRGDQITVAALPFDQTAAEAAAQEVKDAQAAASKAQVLSLVKNGAIGLGVLLVVLVAWLRSRRRGGAVEEYEEDLDEPLGLTEEQLLELERLRVDSVRDAGVEDQALQLEAAQRQRVRGEISSMVTERPDEVAQMLRGWLTESRS